jgi:hypothetical protein
MHPSVKQIWCGSVSLAPLTSVTKWTTEAPRSDVNVAALSTNAGYETTNVRVLGVITPDRDPDTAPGPHFVGRIVNRSGDSPATLVSPGGPAGNVHGPPSLSEDQSDATSRPTAKTPRRRAPEP